VSTRLAVALAIIVFLGVLAGLGTISGNVTFFSTKSHPELPLKGVTGKVIARDFGTLEPLNAGLGVCNIGGTRQGRYDASNKMIDSLHALLRDLNTTYVPSRYVDGNDAVRHAVQQQFGLIPEQAYALLGQGRCLTALDQPAEATRALVQAREIFDTLKAAPALAETDALLHQAGALTA
jgi:hypothetical protein